MSQQSSGCFKFDGHGLQSSFVFFESSDFTSSAVVVSDPGASVVVGSFEASAAAGAGASVVASSASASSAKVDYLKMTN